MSQVLPSFTRPSKWNWSGQPEPNKSQNQLYFVWWEWKPIFQPWFWFDTEGDNAPVDEDDNEIEPFHLSPHFRFNCFLFKGSKDTKRVEANMMLIKTMSTRDKKWGVIAMNITFFSDLNSAITHFCIFYFGFCLLCFCWGACLFALAGNWRGRETPLRTFFTSWAMKNVSHFSFTFSLVLFLPNHPFVTIKRLVRAATSAWEPISCYNSVGVEPRASFNIISTSGDFHFHFFSTFNTSGDFHFFPPSILPETFTFTFFYLQHFRRLSLFFTSLFPQEKA